MGVASWSFDLVWAVGGSGPVGGLLPAESWAADRRALVCGVVVGLPGAGIGDAPVAAWFGGGGCPCVVWGWHAVGVLGQCALVAWPAFSASLFVGGVGVGVGGLVVNCIVDASILL